MRRTELLVAGTAGVGLLFAIIADAAQNRLLSYEPKQRPGVAQNISESEAHELWPGVMLTDDETTPYAFATGSALSGDAIARIAAIEPAAGDERNPQSAALTVRQLARDALQLLEDESLSDDARAAKFRHLLNRDFDLPLIAKFALGRHWRQATAEQRETYVSAFTDHLLTSYASQIASADFTALEIIGTQSAGKRDVMVESRVRRRNGDPITLFWRLRARDGQFRIVDIVAEGISLALTKRQEFAAIIRSGGNDVDELIRKLAART